MSEIPKEATRTIRETLEDWFDGEGLSVEEVSAEALDRLARWLFGAPELAECRVERDRLREALQAIAGCESRFPGDVVDVARRALDPLVSEGETDG
jgi:hypothetical protein